MFQDRRGSDRQLDRVRRDGGASRRARFVARLAAWMLMAACAAVPAGRAVADKGDCSQPQTTGPSPTAADCVYILKGAVDLVSCSLCTCDVNGSQSVSAADALVCLRGAVGQSVTLECPPCTPSTTTTTTTRQIGGATTSTSTSSTTTTLPRLCSSNADCAVLGPPYRCNPFTGGYCDKPCSGNKDCQDFYECNSDKYCAPPLLLY